MNFDALRRMSPEQAMQAASTELGLPEDFFARQWKRESNEGRSMRSRVGAEGHFQIMPNTRKVLEGRAKRSYNPDEFFDGLEMAATVMKENLQKFGNVPDATRAYNAGWNRAAWNNPETNGYVAFILGDQAAGPSAPTQQPAGLPAKGTVPAAVTAAFPAGTHPYADWPVLPSLEGPGKGSRSGQEREMQQGLGVGLSAMNDELVRRSSDSSVTNAAAAKRQQLAEAEFARADAVDFGDAFYEALRDPRVMPTWSVMAAINKPQEAPVAGWDYMENREEIEAPCGGDDDCRGYMRENVTGPATAERAAAEWRNRFGQDATYRDAGQWTSFGAQMSAGLFDPASWAAGHALGKLFQAGRFGLRATNAARAGFSGVGAAALEGALGNVIVEGISDAAGEQKGIDDYAEAALMGPAFTVPFARGAYRQGVNNHITGLLDEANRRLRDNGPQDPGQQVRDVKDALNQGGKGADKVVPDDVVQDIRDDINPPPKPDDSTLPRPPVKPDDSTLPRPPEDVAPPLPELDTTNPPDTVVDPVKPDESLDLPVLDTVVEPEVLPGKGDGGLPPVDPNLLDAKDIGKGDAGGGGGLEMKKLPEDLRDAKPKYGFGKRLFDLTFANDGDLALYVVGGKGQSKAHSRYFRFLQDEYGLSEEMARSMGGVLRKYIKSLAQSKINYNDPDGALNVNTFLDKVMDDSGNKGGGEGDPLPVIDEQLTEIKDGEKTYEFRFWREQPVDLGRRIPLFSDGRKATNTLSEAVDLTLAELRRRGAEQSTELAHLVHALEAFKKSAPGVLQDTYFTFSKKSATRAHFDPSRRLVDLEREVYVRPDGDKVRSTAAYLRELTAYGLHVMVHEVAHAVSWHRIEAVLRAEADGQLDRIHPEHVAAVRDLQDLFRRFTDETSKLTPGTYLGQEFAANADIRVPHALMAGRGPFYASQDLHEFVAQFFNDGASRVVLSRIPGKTIGQKVQSLFQEMVSAMKRLLLLDDSSPTPDYTGVDEMGQILGRLLEAPVNPMAYRGGVPMVAQAPGNAPQGRGVNPQARLAAAARWARRMYQHADAWVAANPIDLDRLKVVTEKFGGMSDGLILARSKNSIANLVASLVTETTTGAAGRKPTVALRQVLLNNQLVGNFRIDFDNAYLVWRQKNNGSVWEDMNSGEVKRRFSAAVFEELHRRRDPSYQPSGPREVIEAADAAEKLFGRSRDAQVEANTTGSGWLPLTSRGYVPQSLDGRKISSMTVADATALSDHLARHWEQNLNWERQFAQQFATFYIERARKRVLGSKEFDMAGSGNFADDVRMALEEMNVDPALANLTDIALERNAALSHLKKRLDVDMLGTLSNGKRVMDYFVTDVDMLARTHARRVSGEVALTDVGILGRRGVAHLRDAMTQRDASHDTATPEELEAFDRVMAEIMGHPVPGAVHSNGATNLRLLVSLQRLGSLVFTQAAEQFNMLHHLGLRSTLGGIAALPRMLGEVSRQKRGGNANNRTLWSLEVMGGEIGQAGYKIIAPLDAPDHALGQYMDDPGLASRLLRAGGHLQSKVSGFRGLMAAQHRAVAEQITIKALRYIRDSKITVSGDSTVHVGFDEALADMGFTADVVRAIKADLPLIATWNGDRLASLDLTKAGDTTAAHAFMQAVHRGTSQIIQGSFIGERNKWAHNDWLKLLLQLRTFGILAAEKQWGRTRMNSGYAYAAGALLGQMALAVPLHAARVGLMSLGREDQEKYIKENLHPAALVRAVMNYSSMSGISGDLLEGLTGLAGGWGGDDAKELLGAKQSVGGVSRLIPAVGSVDQMLRVARGDASVYTALRQLPFSSLWWLTPLVNVTKDD